MRRWAIVALAIGLTIGAGACVLGPKQDDPAAGGTGLDATPGNDTGGGFNVDSSTVSDSHTPPPGDAGGDTPVVPPDAAADAPGGDTASTDAPADSSPTDTGSSDTGSTDTTSDAPPSDAPPSDALPIDAPSIDGGDLDAVVDDAPLADAATD
jgi:hypothetical protein